MHDFGQKVEGSELLAADFARIVRCTVLRAAQVDRTGMTVK